MSLPLVKNSLKIQLDKLPLYSYFKGEWTYTIPKDFINSILTCDEITDVCKASFKNNIVDALRNGVLRVEWKTTKIPYGRLYSGKFDNSRAHGSIGTMARQIKNTFFKREGWVDFDFKKCHASIIIELIQLSGINIDTSAIHDFIHNFDNGLADAFIKYYSQDINNPLNKDDVKQLFNGCLFGQGFESWKSWVETDDPEKNYIGKKVNVLPTPIEYDNFKNTIALFRERVIQDNPELFDIVKDNKLKNGDSSSYYEICSSTLSYYLQIVEKHCLYHAYKFFVENKFIEPKKADLCYDGFTAKLLDGCPEMSLILQKVNDYIAKTTGVKLILVDKPFKDTIESIVNMPTEDDGIHAEMYAESHLEACNIMYERIKNDFKLCSIGEAHKIYFKTNVGTWACDNTQLKCKLVYLCNNSNIFRKNEKGVVSPFLQTLQHAQAVANLIFNKIMSEEADPTFYSKFHSTTVGKLCFKNGVLNVATREFKLWKDIPEGEIFTRTIIPRDYSQCYDKQIYEDIIEKQMKPMFESNTCAMLYYLSKSIAGEAGKNWATYKGARDCGKGVLYALLEYTFGDYIGSFNVGDIMYCRKSEGFVSLTDAKSLGWLLEIINCRLAVSQEVPDDKSTKVVCGELLKKIMSGGDTIEARKLHENIQKVVPHFGMLIMGNYELKIDDAGLNKKRLDMVGSKSFVSQYTIDSKKQAISSMKTNDYTRDMLLKKIDNTLAVADENIKQLVKSPEYADAFIQIMLDYYNKPVQIGSIDDVILEDNEDDETPATMEGILFKKYIMTGSSENVVLLTDIYDCMSGFNKKDVKKFLEDTGIIIKKNNSKKDPTFKDKQCAFGIKLKPTEEEEEYTDEEIYEE